MLCMMLTIVAVIASPRSRAAGQSDVAARHFATGVQAFRDGDYETARQAFEAARASGLDSQQLHYNLGATYYRLHRYAAAREEFAALSNDAAVADLARYNLGLIAVKQHRDAAAVAAFSAVRDTTRNLKLKSLAEHQLQTLGRQPSRWQGWVGFLDLAAGYDDNVALSSDIAGIGPSQRSSSYASVLAGGVGRLSGDSKQGWQGVAAVYAVDYASLPDFNQVYARAGARYRLPLGDRWEARLGGYFSHTTLGGSPFESALSARARFQRNWSQTQRVSLELGHDAVHGAGDYGYLGGSEDWLEVADRYQVDAWRFTAGYRYETNARDDIVQPGRFISVSPRRQSLFAGARLALTERLDLDAEASWRRSVYRDSNQYSGGTQIRRSDRQLSLEVGAAYELVDGWKLAGSYRYLKNRSNIDPYGYRSNRIELTLKHLFL